MNYCLAYSIYLSIVVMSCMAMPYYYEKAATNFNSFNDYKRINATNLQGSIKDDPETCRDMSPLCRHMATKENCDSIDTVIRDCRRSCGKCTDHNTTHHNDDPDICKDQSPLCRHMASRENCETIDTVMRDCRRSCGFCTVECKSVVDRKSCNETEPTPCHAKGCCWDETKTNGPSCFCDFLNVQCRNATETKRPTLQEFQVIHLWV